MSDKLGAIRLPRRSDRAPKTHLTPSKVTRAEKEAWITCRTHESREWLNLIHAVQLIRRERLGASPKERERVNIERDYDAGLDRIIEAMNEQTAPKTSEEPDVGQSPAWDTSQPIAHPVGTAHFKCTCGARLVFSEKSFQRTCVVDLKREGSLKTGRCPVCGITHTVEVITP